MITRRTNASKLKELIYAIAQQDDVNTGVAKARFAGEANYSVPSLERLMRGEPPSEEVFKSTIRAAKSRGFNVPEDELFPPVTAGTKVG